MGSAAAEQHSDDFFLLHTHTNCDLSLHSVSDDRRASDHPNTDASGAQSKLSGVGGNKQDTPASAGSSKIVSVALRVSRHSRAPKSLRVLVPYKRLA